MSPVRRKTTWAAIADGAKALIMVNDGSDAAPNMSVVSKIESENPAAREQGADRPGRRSDGGPGHRSAMESTDRHELEKDHFIAEVAERLNRAAQRGLFERLIVAAPPRVLGQLRPALSTQTAACVVAEIGSDLTGHRVEAIEAHIAKALTR